MHADKFILYRVLGVVFCFPVRSLQVRTPRLDIFVMTAETFLLFSPIIMPVLKSESAIK